MTTGPIGARGLGGMQHAPEMQLGQVLSKKVGTIDYDFQGYLSYGRVAQTTGLGIIPKNSFYYKDSGTGLYAPVFGAKVTADSALTFTVDDEPNDILKFGTGAAPLRVFDSSANGWAASTAHVIASSVESTGVATITPTSFSDILTIQAGSDYVFVGAGVENVSDWVLYDQIVDVSASGKPVAQADNIINSFVYEGRVNTAAIAQWADFPTALQTYVKLYCQRLFVDTL